jgi:hypothetical protein
LSASITSLALSIGLISFLNRSEEFIVPSWPAKQSFFFVPTLARVKIIAKLAALLCASRAREDLSETPLPSHPRLEALPLMALRVQQVGHF